MRSVAFGELGDMSRESGGEGSIFICGVERGLQNASLPVTALWGPAAPAQPFCGWCGDGGGEGGHDRQRSLG